MTVVPGTLSPTHWDVFTTVILSSQVSKSVDSAFLATVLSGDYSRWTKYQGYESLISRFKGRAQDTTPETAVCLGYLLPSKEFANV